MRKYFTACFLFFSLLPLLWEGSGMDLFSQPNQTKFRIIYNWSTSGNLFFTPWSTKNSFSNGYTAMGWVTSTSDFLGAGFAFEIDTMGVIKWARRYRGDNFGFTPMFFYDFIKAGGNYIITGSRNSRSLLMSINSNGSTVNWRNTYLGGSSWGTRVKEDASGNFVVAGGSDAKAINPNKDSTSIYIFKTNSGGTFQWGRSYTLTSPTFDSHDDALDVVTVSDGYVFTGYHSENNASDTTTNILLFKTDFNGTLMWMNSFGALSTNEEGRRILYDAANNQFVILGNTNAVLPFGGLFLMRTDASGNFITSTAYGTPFGVAVADQFVSTSSGGYAVMGWAAVFAATTYKPWILNLNSSFGQIWTKYYNPTTLGGFFTYGEEATNKGFIFSTLSADTVNFGWATELIKTDSQGKTDNSVSSCSETNYTPVSASYTPLQKSISPTVHTGGSGSSFTGTNPTFNPAQVTVCMVCAKPPANVTVAPALTICAGSSATLTASGGGIYSWNTGQTTATIVVSPPSTSTYSVWVNVAGCDSIVPVTVTVNPGPAANINGATTICQGQSAMLTASGGGTYSWNTGQTIATIVVNPSSTTTYTVIVTDASNCTNSATATITVNTTPAASISGNTTICAGDAATLTASGGSTYSWWNNGSGSSTITDFPSSSTTYTVTVSNGNCSDTATITVAVNPIPNTSVSGNNNICLGETATLTASGGGTYSWNTGATTAVITDNPTATTSYTVFVTGANGCTDTAITTVNVFLPPVASVSGNDTICSGQPAVITASGGLTYSWSTGATISSITVFPSTSSVYSVIVSAGNCSDTANFTVTVNPTPNASISGNTTICLGSSTTLTASGGSAYSWNTGATTVSIVANPTTATSYSVVVSNGLCADTVAVNITVSPPVMANVSGTGTTLCSGQSVTLTASGGTNYSWSTGATVSSIVVSPSSSTTYTVTVSNGACSDDTTIFVIVNPPPNANVSASSNAICAGQSATLTASGGGTYSWNTGATASSIIVSPSAFSSYTVVVTDANGCTDSAVATITVTPVPVVTISSNVTICAGDAVTLTAGGGTVYSWIPGGQTSSSIIVSPGTTTGYTVVAANGICTDTASVVVIVNPTPLATAASNVTINYGNSATLTAGGGGIYSWSTGETSAIITVSPTATTIYCVTVTDANNCTDSACATVTVEYNCGDIFIPNAFSPNADGKNDVFRVKYFCMKTIHLAVYDRWGVKVFETSDNTQGWDGMRNGKMENSGVFVWVLVYETILGETGKKTGNVTLVR